MVSTSQLRACIMATFVMMTMLNSSICSADDVDNFISDVENRESLDSDGANFKEHGVITSAENFIQNSLDAVDGIDDKKFDTYRMLVFLNPIYVQKFSTPNYPKFSITANMPDQLRLTPVTISNGISRAIDAKPLSSQTDRCAGSYGCAFIVNRLFAAESMSDEGVSFFIIPQRDTQKYINGWGKPFQPSKWGNAYRVDNCKFRNNCQITFGNQVVGEVKIYKHLRGDKGRCTVQPNDDDRRPTAYQWFIARQLVGFFRDDFIDGPIRRDKNVEQRNSRIRRLAYNMEGDNLDKALRVLSMGSQLEEMKYFSAAMFWLIEQTIENPVILVKIKIPRTATVKAPKGIDLKKGKVRSQKIRFKFEIPVTDLLSYFQEEYEKLATAQYKMDVRATASILESDSHACGN